MCLFFGWLVSHHVVSLVAGERDLSFPQSALIGTAVQRRFGTIGRGTALRDRRSWIRLSIMSLEFLLT